MSLDSIFKEGYKKSMEVYGDDQKRFLSVIAEARRMPVQWIEDAQGVFVPNNEYLREVFGDGVLEYDCYRDGICLWDNALIFPVRGIDGCVAGIAGFYPFDYVEGGERYYAYSSDKVFRKGRYLYFPQHSLMDSVSEGYVVLVDGLFDAISLCGKGYLAASLMGSNLTPEVVMQLRFVKHVIYVADNDSAGYKLYGRLTKQLNNVELLKHKKVKDADEAIKSEHADDFTRELDKVLFKFGIRNQKLEI